MEGPALVRISTAVDEWLGPFAPPRVTLLQPIRLAQLCSVPATTLIQPHRASRTNSVSEPAPIKA